LEQSLGQSLDSLTTGHHCDAQQLCHVLCRRAIP
jgi:hypothetical protein